MVWEGHVTRTGWITYIYKIMIGKCKRKSYHLADLPSHWCSKQTVGIWTEPLVLGQDRVQWRAVVEIVMTFVIHKRRGVS